MLVDFLGGQAAVDGVENRELRLLDRRDRVVDGETGLPLQPVCAACGSFDVAFVLLVAMSAFKWFMSSVIFAFTAAQFRVVVSFADLTS